MLAVVGNDDDRAGGMARDLVADGPEQQPDEAAVTAGADDEQVCFLREVDQRL